MRRAISVSTCTNETNDLGLKQAQRAVKGETAGKNMCRLMRQQESPRRSFMVARQAAR